MGRPRKTSCNAATPQTAAIAPKAKPAPPRSSALSTAAPTSGRTSAAPAAKSAGDRKGQVDKPASTPSSRGQSYQVRSTAVHGSDHGDGKSSTGTRAKNSTASREGKTHFVGAEASTTASAKPSQAAVKTRGRTSNLSSPLPTRKVAEIERQTRGQQTNPEWHKWRENRITASVAPKIANSKFANGQTLEVPQSYLKAVVKSGSSVQTPAMSWGTRNEKKAVEAYEVLKSSKTNRPVKVDGCGLFIDKEKTWLAASPDGIVREADTGKELGVLEVKCPYKHRNKSVTEACKDKTFCLEKKGDSYSLKKTHPYYTQVQCQMQVTGLEKADFVVHTNKETVITPVNFDPVFWEKTVPKLEKFYTDAVVPYLEEKQSVGVWANEE